MNKKMVASQLRKKWTSSDSGLDVTSESFILKCQPAVDGMSGFGVGKDDGIYSC